MSAATQPAAPGDTDAALDFLKGFTSATGAESVCLVAIVPDGPTETVTFDAGDAPGMRAWIDARQGIKNLYFTVNKVKGRPTSKPSKDDIAEAVAVWADLDPKDGA